jgi:hypothetical protein
LDSCKLRHARLDLGGLDTQLLGQSLSGLGFVRQELVQRRIEQTDRDGQALHRLEDALEVLALESAAAFSRAA